MAPDATHASGLTFPRETFAKITPKAFLQAHLKQAQPTRAGGRSPEEFREQTVNTGSLTQSNGSAVVRCGDTAIVCGVRGEILLASDIPHPPNSDVSDEDLVETLGLLVTNVELSTGCSPAHLPGNPPGTLAQSLSHRMQALLYNSGMIDPSALKVQYEQPSTDDELEDEGTRTITKAYWTLYIDVLCIALDGNAFDTAWTAILASLQDTLLPKAWWDPDREGILCSPASADARRLRLQVLPMASSFVVFTNTSSSREQGDARSWMLGDPDTFEEDVCQESLTIVTTHDRGRPSILRTEKQGGCTIDHHMLSQCAKIAEQRFPAWQQSLRPS